MVRKVHFIFFQLLVDSKKGRKKERKKKEKEKKVQIRFPVYRIILRQLPPKKKKKLYYATSWKSRKKTAITYILIIPDLEVRSHSLR